MKRRPGLDPETPYTVTSHAENMMYATPQDKPRLRRMLTAGRIARKLCPCRFGHIGPFVPRPDLTAWREANPLGLPQVDCLTCLSSITDPRTVRA